jgi:hypothetical protein
MLLYHGNTADALRRAPIRHGIFAATGAVAPWMNDLSLPHPPEDVPVAATPHRRFPPRRPCVSLLTPKTLYDCDAGVPRDVFPLFSRLFKDL